MRKLLILALLPLAACSTMTDVQPIGQGRFTVATSVRGGLTSDGEVKAGALKRAREYCGAKEMVLLSAESSGARGWTPQNAEITFKCE